MGILLCRKKKKSNSLEESQHEFMINQKNVDVYNVKKQLKNMKDELKSIKIINCISNRDRFESVDILLLREDLQVSDFPKLQSVSIEFIRQQEKNATNNIKNSNIKLVQSQVNKESKIPTNKIKQIQNLLDQQKPQQQDTSDQGLLKNAESHFGDQFSRKRLDDKLYEKALRTIQKDMKTHFLLRYTVNQEQLIINQLAFKDKRAFLYMMRKMKQLNCTLKRIIFKDIITLKKNIFITICQQMREIQNLEEIQIVNTNLMSEQVYQLQYFLCWMQKQVKTLIISGANLNDEHIDILFFQKFRINDFYALENLELKNCPQLWKSDKYILLMKQYTQFKLNINTEPTIKQSAVQKQGMQENKDTKKSIQSKSKVLLAIQNDEQLSSKQEQDQNTSKINNQLEGDVQQNKRSEGKVEEQDKNKIVQINDIPLQINEKKDEQTNSKEINNQSDKPEQTKIDVSDKNIGENNIQQEQKLVTTTNLVQNNFETEVISQKNQQDAFESESRLKQIYSDMTYDNRHERQFLIGQFLWESQIQESYDDNDIDAIVNNSINNNNLASSGSIIQGNNNSNITDKRMSQQDSQFFNQFFKQCIRELMELDLCRVIDFSSLNYQNFSLDQKKQISQYIISSNTIQTFIIQYDRIFFKEFCELISNKYKTKRQKLFDSYKKELLKMIKQKNTEELDYYLENPQIFFHSNLKNNLLSLENITIIASKFDQFQFDSFCFFSFLSMFLLSIEIDFQKQQVEDQAIFPTYHQIFEYLRKMVEIHIYDEEDILDDENITSSKIDSEQLNNNNNEDLNEENKNLEPKNIQNNQLESDVIDLSKKIKNSQDKVNNFRAQNQNYFGAQNQSNSLTSQIFEAIRNYQNMFDLQTSLQDFKLKNFTWKNAQGFNNEKSFSQFLFTYFSLNADSIMNLEFYNAQISHSSLSRLQEIIKIVFSKYKYYNEMENQDQSTSIFNQVENIHINKFIQKNIQNSYLKSSSFRNSLQLDKNKKIQKEFNLMKTQKSIMYNPSKLNSLQTLQQKNTLRENQINQAVRSSRDSSNLKDPALQKPQKSILEMSKSKTKNKYFLNRFKIKFIDKKIINVPQILNSFGRICKYVEILNASCLDPYEMELLKQQDQQIADQVATASKMIQSIKIANQIGNLENPILFNQRGKSVLNNLGQSNILTYPSILNSQSIFKQQNTFRNFQVSNQSEHGRSKTSTKNILSSIRLVDYIGFSIKDIQEINNQVENITELVLVRCRISLQTLKQIAQKLSSFKYLKKLVLSGNNFSLSSQVIANNLRNNLNQQLSTEVRKSFFGSFDLKNENQKKQQNLQLLKQKKQKLGNSISLNYNSYLELPSSSAQIYQEEGKEVDIEKLTKETFQFCIQNILQVSNLKYLDLSNNDFDELFGEILCNELTKRSLYFLQNKTKQQNIKYTKKDYVMNQQNYQVNNTDNISNDNFKEFSFNNQKQQQSSLPRKSGFYSKFIAEQLNSNVNQRNSLNGKKKLSKLRHLNTNFFSETDDNQGEENQNNFYNNQLEKLTENDQQDDECSSEESKENLQTIKNAYNEQADTQNQIQYIQDMVIDDHPDISERANINQTEQNKFYGGKQKQVYQQSQFGNQRYSLQEPTSLLMNNLSNYNNRFSLKANHVLEKIPENDLERLESNRSQQNFQINNQNIFRADKKERNFEYENLNVPDILEFYIQNNNFKKKTTAKLIKSIGILFDKLEVLDISAKSYNANKIEKQQNDLKQSSWLQTKKNQFNIQEQKQNKQNDEINSNLLSGKSEKESSSFEGNSYSLKSEEQDSIKSDLNYMGSNEERDDSGSLLIEKISSYEKQPQFQKLQKLIVKDINLSVFEYHSIIKYMFLFPSIQELDLSGCLQSDQSVELILAEVNPILVSSLKKLNLSRNKNLKSASWKSIIVLFFCEIKTIESLNLSDCSLNEDKILGIIEGFNELQNDSQLKELILARNIRLEGILKKFSFILTQINYLHLQILDLTGCNLNDQSCENMIQGLLYGRKKRHQIINNYLLNIKGDQQQQQQQQPEGFQGEFKYQLKEKDNLQKSSLVHSKSFQLIKLILYDNNISMKMQLLTQYCFVFQIQEEDNILFRMHFSSNDEQKKQLNKIWNNLKEKKGLIYSNIHHRLLEEYSVNSQTLVLGPNLFSSKKVAEDILLNCLRTFNSVRKLKLYVNDKIVSIMNGVANSEKLYGQESSNLLEKSQAINKNRKSILNSIENKKQQNSANTLTNQSDSTSTLNNPKGFFIIQHQFKKGSKKLTLIPRSRFQNKPQTQVLQQQQKNFQIDRQITLPNNLNDINQTEKITNDSQRTKNNHFTLIQDKNHHKNIQFGIKNRLQELSNQILQHKNGSFPVAQNLEQNSESLEAAKNINGLSSKLIIEDNTIQKQKNSLLEKSPFSHNRSQETTPMSQKIIEHLNKDFSQFQQQKEQNFSNAFNHELFQEITGKKNVQKNLINEMSEQNSINHDFPIVSNSEKQSSYEASPNHQMNLNHNKLQHPAQKNQYTQNQISLKLNCDNESYNIETQSQNKVQYIPTISNHKKLTEVNNINNLADSGHQLQPQSPKKTKSIIKNSKSFLDSEADLYQPKKKSFHSPSFNEPDLFNNNLYNKKGSFLFGKDFSVKKTLTIIDQSEKSIKSDKSKNSKKTSSRIDESQNKSHNSSSRNQTQSNGQLNEQQINEINEKINNPKYENSIIHLKDVESLILQSDEKVGIVNLLDFFSVITDNIKIVDFSKIIMSHQMFVRVAFRVLEIFQNINQVKFANLQLQLKNEHQSHQTGQALHNLFTTPYIQKLEFVNCQFTEQLIEHIINPQQKGSEEPSFFVKEVDFSQNKNISFSKEENLILLESVEILKLSDCSLNENKINININTWKREYLEDLIDLDLSYNKGLSPKFFCNLGQYISKRKKLQKLNISYTGMYVEKQKQFSYGLHYKNGISNLDLQQLIMREIRFCKKEGTLMLFKALSKLPCLEVLDMSEMQISNYQELDILHNYFRHEYIGKFTKIKKFYLQNCQFLFDTIPYYDFNSKYSLLEYNHFSLFLLTQFQNIIFLDLTGCLSLKKHSKKFLQELDVMRRKKLFNYTIKDLNISRNVIPSKEIRDFICHILFVFKNIQTLQMRSLVHYEQNYVQNILDAFDSFSYFQFLQNQNYQEKKDAEQQGKEIAEAFLKIKNERLGQQDSKINGKESESSVNFENIKKSSFQNHNFSFNSSQMRHLSNQEENMSLNLTQIVFSDISNELIQNKANIDMLLGICATNKIFANLKKILIHAEYTEVTNLVRLQNLYNDSLLELNEKIQEIQQEPNTDFEIRFKFKESQQLIVLKPEMKKNKTTQASNKDEKILKKSIYFNGQAVQQKTIKDNSHKKFATKILQKESQGFSGAYDSPRQQKGVSFQSFTKMRLDYMDEVIEIEEKKEEEEMEIQNKFKSSFFQNDVSKKNNNKIKHSHFSINESNEYLFHSFSSENEDDQIQIWRQFQSFLKKLSNNKLYSKTHISLNYKDPKLKLLSSFYNIFIDNKYEFNTNINILFNGVDSLYLGNMLYYFLVQICSFKPQSDLIDFLINLLIFISKNKFQSLTSKIIRLPPFLILTEEDASRIQTAFMNIQMESPQNKKIQKMISSLGQKGKLTQSQLGNLPTKQFSLQSRISSKDESDLFQQRNRIAQQQKDYLDKKRLEYKNVTQLLQKFRVTKTNQQKNDKNQQKNQIVCNYFYKSSQGCQEYIEIEKIKKMPPSTLNIENFSINGLKAVYMICYHNDYFIKGDIDYESIMFISTSLSFSLREYFYKKYTSSKRFWFRSTFYRTMYLIMDIFVDVDIYFKYDESIDALERDLKNSNKSNIFFIFMIISLYIIIYILTPIFSFIDIGPQDNDHLSYIMHGIFALYAIISFLFEIFCMRKVLILTRHLIPDINLVHQNNLIAKIRDFIYEKIINIETFNYKDILFYQKIVFSFLSQLDAYQDVCFILVTYHKEDYLIAIFAMVVLSYTKFTEIVLFFKMIQKNSYSNLFFQNTNTIYEYCQLIYLEGLSSILDVISPHNSLRITENSFTKIIFPKKFIGLTINKQIFHRIMKVITCDLPQILLQILYIFRNVSNKSTTVQLSIVLNIISLLISLYVLLTIKQSVLNQMDFDELSEQKSEFLQAQFLQYQQKEIEMFDQINSNVQSFGEKQFQGEDKNNLSIDNISNKSALQKSDSNNKKVTIQFESEQKEIQKQ